MEQEIKVAIVGVTGYTGLELLRVLLKHKYVKITNLVSFSHKGKRLGEVINPVVAGEYAGSLLKDSIDEEVDLVFLCTPHEYSLTAVPDIIRKGIKVIDLSGAYRIKERKIYEEYYNFMHEYTEELNKAVYGLPEIFREEIKKADLVANPGCYPTATLLGLYPFLKAGIIPAKVVVHAVSGVSGAGRKLQQRFHFPEMESDAFIYSPVKHRHTPEMEDVIRRLGAEVKIRFTPSVIPVSRGMISTIYFEYEKKVDVKSLFLDTYREERFIKIIEEPPHISWVRYTNYALLYPFYDDRTGVYCVISAIDNLGKGASMQAVQNMNIMMGISEEEALNYIPSIV